MVSTIQNCAAGAHGFVGTDIVDTGIAAVHDRQLQCGGAELACPSGELSVGTRIAGSEAADIGVAVDHHPPSRPPPTADCA